MDTIGDMETVSRPVCKCRKCGWEWIAVTEALPKRCANKMCRSPYWQTQIVVYVLLWNEGLYKIGCTDNIKQRWQHNDTRAAVIAQIPCGSVNKYSVEAAVHALFAHKRMGRKAEVFKLNDEDVRLLQEIAAADDPMTFMRSLNNKQS